jgi:DNA-binding transcriptional LysR family regulator
MLPVTLRGLEVFIAVVDAGGFGAAAVSLGITQPSVSVHVRELEAKMGGPLFERRSGATPQLTEAGRSFYAYALETLERTRAISANLSHSKRKLRFAAQRFVANSLLPKALEEFTGAFPQIEPVVRTGTFEEVHALFTRGQVDLAFLMSAGEVPGLHTEAMGRYRLAFIAAPGHPLAKARGISVETLASHPFVIAYDASYFGRTIAGMLRSIGLVEPRIASQVQEMSMVRDLVIAELGIACVLRRSVQKELASGVLAELDVAAPPLHMVLNYARTPRADLPEIEALIEMMRRAEGFAA